MANLDFFAALEDHLEVLRFIYEETDAQVFELSSRPDHHIRSFASVDDLAREFSLGGDGSGTSAGPLLTLYSPAVMADLKVRRIEFDPSRSKGVRFREELDGGGLIQLYLGGLGDGVITKSHFGHNSPERARKWDVADGVNWNALSKLSGRIQRHVRKLAVAKLPGRPVLACAAGMWGKGYLLKEFSTSPYHWTAEGLRPDA